MANFHSMNSSRLPAKGVVGDVYMATETRDLFIAVADGRLIPLAGLLNPVTVVGARGPQGETGVAGGIGPHGLQGPAGRDGVDGKSVSGPKGSRGATGATGKDGRDGVDGKDGATGAQGPQGIQGPKGDKGDVLYVGDAEMEAAVKEARAAMIDQHARFLAAIRQALSHAGNLPASNKAAVQGVITKMRQDAGLEKRRPHGHYAKSRIAFKRPRCGYAQRWHLGF